MTTEYEAPTFNPKTLTNQRRREMLSDARAYAVEWAKRAERGGTPSNGYTTELCATMANMWANIAQALKLENELSH